MGECQSPWGGAGVGPGLIQEQLTATRLFSVDLGQEGRWEGRNSETRSIRTLG